MSTPHIVSQEDWLDARKKLLIEEKAFQKQRDSLNAARRQLPWVAVKKDYEFKDVTSGKTLGELFGSKSQLIVQHFMMGENWQEGCQSCSFWADGFDGTTVHLAARDAAFVAVSNAPIDNISRYKERMGWRFDWLSSFGSSFNRDFHVSFDQAQIDSGAVEYNYRVSAITMDELPGISVFVKDEQGNVFHTYSCYARGLDNMNVAYQYMDLLPKGRDEEQLDYPQAWVRRHDQYDTA